MSTMSVPPVARTSPFGEIDVRCAAQLSPSAGICARCQLLAGHDGRHAVLFTRDGRRLLGTWAGASARIVEAEPCESAVMSRPWMRGYPVPAWTEAGAEAG